ncbi:MAG: DNA primase [Methylococcaceae bacterium]|nr:DNA primase [Methylococcaceae bacterium]
MAGRIPRDFIDDLLVRVDIVDLIDSHVPLKKTGSNYAARCPFHNEKSPSFSVNRKKQFFYCFGCGAGGNAITFLMDYSHLEFVEAIEDLATFVGVDVPREESTYNTPAKPDNLKDLYSTLEAVAKFYAQQLKSNPEGQQAIAYLKKRGLSGIIARDFMLGYAPDAWDELGKRFNKKLLLDAGLLINKENGGSYDRFRGRLMFPIRDKRGRILGFGARVLDDSLPKYLNSPETSVFSKGNEVYGLCELLQKNSKPERVLIVEGYMDVIALAQFGLHYAVATLGTATSRTHLDILFRFASELVLCFDGDNAGRKAAWRAVETAMPTLRDGRQIKIMLLPQNEDPDSLIRQEGLEIFSKRIISTQTLSDYFFEHVTRSLDLTSPEGCSQLAAIAEPHLNQIPEGFFKKIMLSKLQDLSKLSEQQLSSSLENSKKLATLKSNALNPRKKRGTKLSTARFTIALLLQNPELAELIIREIPNWKGLDFPSLEVLGNILQTISNNKPANMGALVECYRNTDKEKMINTLAAYELELDNTPKEIIGKMFTDSVNNLIKQAKDELLTNLLLKESNQSLNSEEKQLLIKMLK